MERFNDKTRTKQQLQQSCMIQVYIQKPTAFNTPVISKWNLKLKTIHQHRKQILRNKSNKICRDLYEENYKILTKELKELNKWRGILCLWAGQLNVVKMSILLTLIYRVNEIPVKFSLFYGHQQTDSKVYMKK